jgi:hypothetical protein
MEFHTMLDIRLTAFSTVLIGVLAQAAPVRAADPATPCDGPLGVKDVAGILAGTARVNHASMSAAAPGEGCEMGVEGDRTFALVDISRHKGDKQAFDTLMSLAPPDRTPLKGVGDAAYGFATRASSIPDAKETDVFAHKGDAICVVQLHRTDSPAGRKLVIPNADALPEMLGALCQKMFAASHD